MNGRILIGVQATLISALAVAVFALVLVAVGRTISGLAEQELLANPSFATVISGNPPEYWVQSNNYANTVTLSQTVATPFRGERGNWRIVSTLRLNSANANVTYAIEGRTLGEWKQLDRREVGAASGSVKLVLEPRPLSHISVPPDQLRVSITIDTPQVPEGVLRSASLRVGQAGIFNSLNPPTWGELIGITTGTALATLLLASLIARKWRTPSPLRAAVINALLLVISAVFAIAGLEVLTRTILVFPDSMATTRVSELWWARHWNPINEYGYRDVSHASDDLAGKKVLFIVGDSFAAGHGIARFEDVFHQRIARKLGPNWKVIVLAKPGLSTRDELAALAAYPLKPDAIIVAHVWNDVNSALLAHGIAIPGKPAMQPFVRPVVSRSYFLDFVYWRVRGLRAPMQSYLDLILSAYHDGAIWDTHAEDLSRFIDYARDANAPLLVAAFPALEDVDGSRVTSSHVTEYFQSRNIAAVDFADEFAHDDPRAITVNAFDSHPNEAAHARIAEVLLAQLEIILDNGGTAAP